MVHHLHKSLPTVPNADDVTEEAWTETAHELFCFYYCTDLCIRALFVFVVKVI